MRTGQIGDMLNIRYGKQRIRDVYDSGWTPMRTLSYKLLRLSEASLAFYGLLEQVIQRSVANETTRRDSAMLT